MITCTCQSALKDIHKTKKKYTLSIIDFNIDEFIKKHDVHPETIAFLKAAAAYGERPCHEIGVEAYRKLFDKRNKLMAGEAVFKGSEIELTVSSDDVKVK